MMRIVSLAPSNTEIIYELGAEEHLVGNTALCDHPQEATEKPSVGGWTKIDIEKVKELEPDFAIASDDLQKDIVEELRAEDIEVVHFKPRSLEEVYDSIVALGELLDREKKAWKIIRVMKRRLTDINFQDKRIYCEEWMEPPMISGNWVPGLIEKCNGEYIINEGTRSKEIDLQEINDFDPDVIILNVCGAGENLDKEKLLERRGWESLKAVKEDNVYVLHDALLNRPGPRLIDGARQIENKIVDKPT